MDAADAMNPHIPDVHGDAILVITRAASLDCSIAFDQDEIRSFSRFCNESDVAGIVAGGAKRRVSDVEAAQHPDY
jgi:hypothetical protein